MSETTTEPAVDAETELEPDEELEPADPTEEAETDDEVEPVDDEPATDGEPSSQALLAELEKEHKRHGKAIAKALGIEPDEMHECPTCEGVGFTPEPLEKPSELVQDPFTETCDRCQGNGEVLSGATIRGLYTIPCNGCGGSGYKTKPEQPDAGLAYANGAPPPPTYAPPPAARAEDAAVVEALKARGYTILDPITVPPPVPA